MYPPDDLVDEDLSYPARGTWIEISLPRQMSEIIVVVPRTGYVDRN